MVFDPTLIATLGAALIVSVASFGVLRSLWLPRLLPGTLTCSRCAAQGLPGLYAIAP